MTTAANTPRPFDYDDFGNLRSWQPPTPRKAVVPCEFAALQAPAALALREAKDRIRPFSINKRVPAYRGPIFHGVFS